VTNVVFGIGLNIDHAPALTPSLFVPEATSLAACDATCGGCLPAALREITGRLDREVEALRAGRDTGLFARYRDRAMFLGRRAGIWPEDCDDATAGPPRHQGRVLGLNPDLSLVLEGYPEPVRAGRLALLL
jgi:biotin-(acetyl-CoA carboxylase) ligase